VTGDELAPDDRLRVRFRAAGSGMLRSVSDLADEGRRLALAASLTRYVIERLGDVVQVGDLAGARSLTQGADELAQRHRVRFDPPYPGMVSGDAAKILLACSARRAGGGAIGVVFTTLIPGRRPSVSVAPPGTDLGKGWRPLHATR
jgi:hypothetical protein